MKLLRYTGNASPRLDGFILENEPGLSPGLLHKYLRQNKIKLNGKKQPLATRLAPGDEVRLYLPGGAGDAAPRSLTVLYEDAHIIAVNKPPGLPSLAENGGDSALARLLARAAQEDAPYTPALCHRLDTGTSGVLLAAKHPAALDYVTGLIRGHELQKTYWGVTFGRPQPPGATLTGWHTKDAARGLVRITPQKAPGAKPVETRYETIAVSGRLALLRITLVTGRTHQIRAHLAGIGNPLLGDGKYGSQQANRQLKCRYQCLCAGQVQFPQEAPAAFATLAGLRIACEKPWYYTQLLQGTLQ